MSSFSWLHITDFHFGVVGQKHLWPNTQEAFLKDLELMHQKTGPWKAVIFTGDLVQSGSVTEFEGVQKILDLLWNFFQKSGSNPTLLVVPGNHDLLRPELKNPAARLLTKWNENQEIHNEFWGDAESEYRKIIGNSFSNYLKWRDSCPYINQEQLSKGILPGDFSSSLKADGIDLGVVGLNSSFLQLGAGAFEKKLALDVRQLQAVCDNDASLWMSKHNIRFLLTHHGPIWLNDHTQQKEMGEIAPAGRFLMHLFGHMHEAELKKESYGGGAARRLIQGKSLFGLEHFGEDNKQQRLHGYSVGVFRIDGSDVYSRFWPRTAHYDKINGWKIIPDHLSFSLTEDGGTREERTNLGENYEKIEQTTSATDALRIPSRHSFEVAAGDKKILIKKHHKVHNKWGWPHDEPLLKEYCDAVCRAHSHIRFVEIPYLKDVSDVEIDNLYVESRFSKQEIHPDLSLSRWPQCYDAIAVIRENPNIVLLGDPGSGKSTLVSCLSWQLCRPQPAKNNPWTIAFGGLIPLPIILRELNLKTDLSWESLLDAFLLHRIGKLLKSRSNIEALLKNGRAIVLLDGLDEIGNLSVRRKLRDAVHNGMTTYPQNKWIFTSRIVGYDLAPFHLKTEKINIKKKNKVASLEYTRRTKRVHIEMASLLFLAPFDDEQIKRFSLNWYSQHEKQQDLIASSAQDFLDAVQENEGTQRLARIPYLLTLMALVHHKDARLPHGRTELYERIALAYLESIDHRRQLDQLHYSLSQKKRWLSSIAYQMQLRRSSKRTESNQSEILASRVEVNRWLDKAMAETGTEHSTAESEALLDYFAQRSGLLLPRGEGMFAFMHLSLQEYFAACFIEPRLTASRFGSNKEKNEPSDKKLYTWVNSVVWQEAFVFLFELLSDKPRSETIGFLNLLFKDRLKNDRKGNEAVAASLLAELATNPFVVLPVEERRKMRQQCWRWWLNKGLFSGNNKVIRSLIRESNGDLGNAWKSASLSREELKRIEEINLSGCPTLSNIDVLTQIPKLRFLTIENCQSISRIDPIANLKKITNLNISGCPNITDLIPLENLKTLRWLSIGSSASVTPIAKLKSLKSLELTGPVDLKYIGGLEGLVELHFHYPIVDELDLSPLIGLSKLRRICTMGYSEGAIKISKEIRKKKGIILSPAIMQLLEKRKGPPF